MKREAGQKTARLMKMLGLGGLDLEQALSVFDWLTVLNQGFDYRPLGFSLDLVHDFHGLDDTGDGLFLDLGIHIGKRRAVGRCATIKSADHRGLDIREAGIIIDRSRGGSRSGGGLRGPGGICGSCDLLERSGGKLAVADDRLISGTTLYLYFKALFFDLEFGEVRALH